MVKLNSEGDVSFSNADMGVAPRHDSHFVPKEKRIDFAVKKIKGLYTFNPEINRGVVLFGVSSKCLQTSGQIPSLYVIQ